MMVSMSTLGSESVLIDWLPYENFSCTIYCVLRCYMLLSWILR
jgi:hypothetical protein